MGTTLIIVSPMSYHLFHIELDDFHEVHWSNGWGGNSLGTMKSSSPGKPSIPARLGARVRQCW